MDRQCWAQTVMVHEKGPHVIIISGKGTPLIFQPGLGMKRSQNAHLAFLPCIVGRPVRQGAGVSCSCYERDMESIFIIFLCAPM